MRETTVTKTEVSDPMEECDILKLADCNIKGGEVNLSSNIDKDLY